MGFDVSQYVNHATKDQTIEERCVDFVHKNPGTMLGQLLKKMERKEDVSRKRALEAIQNMVDSGQVIATEHSHSKSGKPFLRFWPTQ